MSLKLCQGPSCHQYDTTDRKRGPKGNKRNITRNVGTYHYGNGNFCDQRCMYDWINKYIEQGLDYFGRTTEAKHLTEQNSWVKREHWSYERERNPNLPEFYYLNKVTEEQRPLTEAQYNDTSYTLNTGE